MELGEALEMMKGKYAGLCHPIGILHAFLCPMMIGSNLFDFLST
jgi:hypothetical protein